MIVGDEKPPLGEVYLEHISEKPWGEYKRVDYTPEEWHRACLIHQHEGEPTAKDQCKLPVLTPDGAVNRNGVHAATAALAGARGGVQATNEEVASARRQLRRLYSELEEEPPPSIAHVEESHYIVHYGVKGMKWGVRKNEDAAVSTGLRLQAPGPVVDPKLHPSTQAAGREVAALMGKRYGFQITEFKDLKTTHPEEAANGTIGFVEYTPGKSGGVVYAKSEDVRQVLKGAEDTGWFAPGTGNPKAFLTHESGHAMFHASQQVQSGFLGPKVVGGHREARDVALKESLKEAKRNGISVYEYSSKVSGYAAGGGSREEMEAELFSQYHWNPNPPSFVRTWGQTLHREMGLDATPFVEESRRG